MMGKLLHRLMGPERLVEAVTIVFSILLAFAIDAWWDTRIESRRSQAQLETISAELRIIEESVTRIRIDFDSLRDAVARLLSSIGPEAPLLDPDQLYEWIDLSFRGQTIELETGSVTALLASGELSNIRNMNLKAALATWPASVARVRLKSAQLEANRELIIDYLNDKFPTLEIAWKTGQMDRYPRSDFPADPAQFQRDMKLEGLFANRGMLIEDTDSYLMEMQQSIANILNLINTP